MPQRIAMALLALLLVVVGGVFISQRADAATGAPVVIDDFSGGILGTRTITYNNGYSSFSQSGGLGHITATAPYADTGGVTLNYALPSATDLTSHGNNTQFFLEFTSILRSPADDFNDAANIGITLTDSSGRQGTYTTGIQSVSPFNIVLNFTCADNSVCFSGSVDFTKITNVQVYVLTPGNYDTHTLTASLDMIRTTPTGGAVPSPPTPNVTTASTSVASLNNTTVDFSVAYVVEGVATDETGLTASSIVVSGTAGGISTYSVSGGPGTYTIAVGPLTSSGTVTISVKAGAVTDGWGQGSDPSSNEPVVTFTKEVVPTISVSPTATATVGTAFDLSSTVAGVPTPTVTLNSGSLPNGLTLSSSGELSGTPAAGSGGVYSPVFKASNAVGSATAGLTLTVNEAPRITSTNSATFSEGVAGSFGITTAGYPAPSLTEANGSTLPTGVTFTDNGNGTATIAGTPAVGTNGTYTVSISASNGIGTTATQSFLLTVTSAPVITTAAHDQTVAPGTSVTFTAAASGTPSPTVQWQRTDSTGAYVNIPDATSTTYTFTATAADAGHRYRAAFSNSVGSVTTTATLTVQLAPSITSGNSTTFVVGHAGDFSITTNALPTAAITMSGVTPEWLSLKDNGDGTAELLGTPPADAAGATISLTLNAANGVAPNANQSFTIVIDETPVVTTSPQATTVTPGTSVTLSAAADGFPVPAVQWQQAPAGSSSFANIGGATSVDLTFVASILGNGEQYRAVFTNSLSSATTDAATVRVGTAPVLTSDGSATFDAGVSSEFPVTTTGEPAPAISALPLPSFLSLTDNGDGTATLSGTPSATDAGVHTFLLTADNTFDPSDSEPFTLTVDAPPTVQSADSTTFDVGTNGDFAITTNPGFPSSTVITESGSLPDGVALSDNGDGTADLSGTPAAGSGGEYDVTITARSVGGDQLGTSQNFVLYVDAAPTIETDPNFIFTAGAFSAFTLETDDAFPAPTVIASAGQLPDGLVFTDNGNGTASLDGTPSAGSGGVYTVELDAAADGGTGLRTSTSMQVTVLEAPTLTSASTTTFQVGVPASFSLTATGGYPTTDGISEDGALPPGISFSATGNGTGSLTGTPSTGAGGDYPITITATALGGPSTVQHFDLVVNETPSFASDASTTFEAGSANTFTVETAHSYPIDPSIGESGSVPNGVTFTDNGDGTATLSGTPTDPGTYDLEFTTSNEQGVFVQQDFALTVATSPTLPTDEDASFTAGVTSSVILVSTPGTPSATTLSVSGTLPDGITFTDNGDGTATLGGAAAPASVGTYPVTFEVSNGVSPALVYPATITVNAADSVTLPSSVPQSSGTVGGVPAQSTQGEVLTVTGTGFAPGAPITIGIYSSPTFLASDVATDGGTFSAKITVPKLLGVHTVVVTGLDPAGDPQFLTSRTTISARTALPLTGVEVGESVYLAFSLLVLGVLALAFAYRRKVSARAPQ